MTPPVPSCIRVVRVGIAPAAFSANFNGPNPYLQWPSKHPLDTDWWWVDATGWCKDVGGTLRDAWPESIDGDGQLLCIDTIISPDGLQAGLLLLGGTTGASYNITTVLTSTTGQDRKAVQAALPMQSTSDVQLPWLANFSSPLNSGNYYYMVGASNARPAASADFSKPFNSQNYYYS